MLRDKTLSLTALGAALLTAVVVSGCAQVKIAPHLAPIPQDTRMLLGRKGLTEAQPIFIRIFKAESELEVWKQREDGNFYHFKTYPICNWSGALGPKFKQGDKQSPEGFYQVTPGLMNPNSRFHLAFNLGYPNAFDRAHRRTGDFLMVHGKCRSAGCYAMTDALMEELYAVAREAFAGGQKRFHVHAFPFRMTPKNMGRYRKSPHYRFWQTLKQGYDYFEVTRKIPNIEVCERNYQVNVEWNGGRLNPRGACPRFRSGPIEPFAPQPITAQNPGQQIAPARPQPVPVIPPFSTQTRRGLTKHIADEPTDPIGQFLSRFRFSKAQ